MLRTAIALYSQVIIFSMHTVKRTILVTGASSGIGLAVVQNLLQQGHTVIGVARRIILLNEYVENYIPVSMDLSQLHNLPEKIRELQKAYPNLDAGIGQFGSIEEFSYAQIESVMTVNFTSQVYLTKALLPDLKRKPYSDLIYIGSEAALKGSRKGAVYCATKYAVNALSDALRMDLLGTKIRVSSIDPGAVETNFSNVRFKGDLVRAAAVYEGMEPLSPNDVADAVLYCITRPMHVNISEVILMPTDQASATMTSRSIGAQK